MEKMSYLECDFLNSLITVIVTVRHLIFARKEYKSNTTTYGQNL